MNDILSRESVFKDALTQLSNEGMKDPFGIHTVHKLVEIEEIVQKDPGIHVFFIGDDIILYNHHQKIPFTSDHSSLHIFYTIFHILANISPLKKPFPKNWKTFQDKLVYYLEIPLDPITFSRLGVDPDLTATNFYEVISYGETTS